MNSTGSKGRNYGSRSSGYKREGGDASHDDDDQVVGDETRTTSSDKERRGSTGDLTRELGNGREAEKMDRRWKDKR